MKTIDRVQAHTAGRINRRIDEEARRRVLNAARETDGEVARRLEALDREWDIERVLQMNASSLALGGVMLGLFVNRRFLALPISVLSFLLLHATQGWCPPVPVLWRLGFRTRKEIDREKCALKALRGDFSEVPRLREQQDLFASASHAWDAASR